jgi:hypothetical protein
MTSFFIDLDIDSDNNNVLNRSAQEENVEESSPGKLLQMSRTEEMETRVPITFELPGQSFWNTNSTVVSFTIPGNYKVYRTATGKNTEIVSNLNYSLSQLGMTGSSRIVTFYVGAIKESSSVGVDQILVTADPDGSGPLSAVSDKITLTAYDFKYVRVYDKNKIPNRSTRAVGIPDDKKSHEDNPRSDYDYAGHPGIMLGGYGEQMSYANIATEVEFSPNGIGKFFLWKITANHGCSLGTSGSGSFANGKTVSHVVYPSSATRASHNESDDIVISVGFDANGDGIFQESEESVPDFQNRLIGKNEYDYCYSQLTNWQKYFAGIVAPQAVELLRIFTGLSQVTDYDSIRTITQKYGGTHQMSNSLGFDETQNITQGQVLEYFWNANSDFSGVILSSNVFFDNIIRSTIQQLNIKQFYEQNPNIDTKTFTVNIKKTIELTGLNLGSALKHCSIDFNFTIFTERGMSFKPQITGISGYGNCKDFYDFRSHGQNDENGWAARLQACHVKGIRDIGEVYSIHIDLRVPETHFWWDVYYDDLDALHNKWNDCISKIFIELA